MQLTLNFCLDQQANFDNFYVGDNETLVASLKSLVAGDGERFVSLWGTNVGRTHLLQACCHAVDENEKGVFYLPLKKYREFSTDVFEGLESLHLLCIDNIEKIAGNKEWEEAFFHCYNRLAQSGTRLVIAGIKPPSRIKFSLSDLRSRLASGVTFQVKSLSDDQKIAALQMRAKARGLVLTESTGRFLLSHYRRDIRSLCELLESLDLATLTEQRKLSIPFIKKLLNLH